MSPGLTACHDCDLLLVDAELPGAGMRACCPRCGACLHRAGHGDLGHMLALALAALILLLIANLFPVVSLDIQGNRVDATIVGAAGQLWSDGMPAVALLVVATAVLMPIVELTAIVWLTLPLALGRRPPGFALVFRAMRLAQPWAMTEVFMLGLLVSLVKLAHMAQVLPGPALWCFGASMLVFAALGGELDRRRLWQAWEAAAP